MQRWLSCLWRPFGLKWNFKQNPVFSRIFGDFQDISGNFTWQAPEAWTSKNVLSCRITSISCPSWRGHRELLNLPLPSQIRWRIASKSEFNLFRLKITYFLYEIPPIQGFWKWVEKSTKVGGRGGHKFEGSSKPVHIRELPPKHDEGRRCPDKSCVFWKHWSTLH